MSADFWAGYASGAIGIVIGNPLDVLKVRLQMSPSFATSGLTTSTRPVSTSFSASFSALCLRPWTGTAAPMLGYGALNALLFVSYNRAESWLDSLLHVPAGTKHLWTTWLAGAAGGLATFAVSTPTELVKCRAQVSSPPTSSWCITRQVLRAEGLGGLYAGGMVTALRDSVGYGFYFWSYELSRRYVRFTTNTTPDGHDAPRALLCGGVAGVVTWASIFPLDVVKTRVQTQEMVAPSSDRTPLLRDGPGDRRRARLGTWRVAMDAYAEGGGRVFWRGITACMVRAAIVNAVQWATYEWVMRELGQGHAARPASSISMPTD